MLKAAVCLEDAENCRKVSKIIETIYNTEYTGPFRRLAIHMYTTSVSFLKAHENYDLVILEAYLEGGAGFSIGKHLWQQYKNTRIIMIRENEDPVRIINQTHCFGIIDREKASGLAELLEAYFLYRKKWAGIHFVPFRTEDRTDELVACAEVLYLSTMPGRRNRIELHMVKDNNILTAVGSMGRVSAPFQEIGFICVSQSFSVNPEYVIRIEKEYITLKNGVCLPVPRRRASKVRRMLMEYRKQKRYNEI